MWSGPDDQHVLPRYERLPPDREQVGRPLIFNLLALRARKITIRIIILIKGECLAIKLIKRVF